MSEIIVIDLLPVDYDETSSLHRPLGGTQSAVIDTCVMLAAHTSVTLCNGVAHPGTSGRLTIKPNSQIALSDLAQARWIVFVSWVTETGLQQLPSGADGPRVALWAHHDVDQRGVQFLSKPAAASRFSRLLFVSRWQRERYLDSFPLARESTGVIGNPYCERALSRAGCGEKRFDKPRLIYTSTPFRGLDLLADAFPLFRRRFPEA